MIGQLQKIETPLVILQEIPATFFSRIEAAVAFDDTLFPDWCNTVFLNTDLKKKFNEVFVKYKSIADKAQRDQVIESFTHTNRVADLCNNHPDVKSIVIKTLPAEIQKEIETLFSYLYSSALNYHEFEKYAKDTIQKAINRFILATGLNICPFCGLEGYLNLKGQQRLALDHWLCKDIFPFAAINFDNLIPIGDKCNERPAKGSTNVLLDDGGNRIVAYYPFDKNDGLQYAFTFNKEPTINDIQNEDWTFSLSPVNPDNAAYFSSWKRVFNIFDRYNDFFIQCVWPGWEAEYAEYIEESGKQHSNTVDEFKQELNNWKAAAFPVKKREGAILYRAFIHYLLHNATPAYLYSLCENFKSRAKA